MHKYKREHDHIPRPDLPRHKRTLGLKPAHLIGVFVLMAILAVYLLLLARKGV
jgi:hypothetical protein